MGAVNFELSQEIRCVASLVFQLLAELDLFECN